MALKSFAVSAVLAAALAPTAALADPVLWTLSGVNFNDGGTASGSFVYDEDTATYSAINITTTAGTIHPGAVYVQRHTGTFLVANASVAYFDSAGGTGGGLPIALLQTASPRTDAGGTLTLVQANSEAICAGADCSGPATSVRRITAGSLIGGAVTLVPTMTEWAMILLGLLLAGGAAVTIQRRHPTVP